MKKTIGFNITLIVNLLLLTIPAFGNFQAGEDAYLRQDYETALKFWQPLAKQGNPEAQNMLGYMYRYGQGVPQDFEQARSWYRRAADQGFARAQNNLGMLYRQGLGVKQNYQIAFQWFHRAAEQGNGGAQNHLGLMYYMGEGVPKDLIQAYKWASLAADRGVDPAIQALTMLRKEMTSSQIEEARTLAREWVPKGKEVTL